MILLARRGGDRDGRVLRRHVGVGLSRVGEAHDAPGCDERFVVRVLNQAAHDLRVWTLETRKRVERLRRAVQRRLHHVGVFDDDPHDAMPPRVDGVAYFGRLLRAEDVLDHVLAWRVRRYEDAVAPTDLVQLGLVAGREEISPCQ